jgi:hypothetical protein
MRGRLAALLIVAATLESTGAFAMRPPTAVTLGHCTIIGEANLPVSAGGSAGLCAVVERAIAARAPSARYTAEVKVLPRSRLSAVLVVDGRTLPEQNFAVMDGQLTPASIQRFADTLADQVFDAARG